MADDKETMKEIDIHKVFKDFEYKQLLIEYYDFMSFILHDINRYTIHSSSVKFTEDAIIYKHKEMFMKMLRETFPSFIITFEKYGEHYDLDEGEYSITVNWENIIK
jgi:hypothetical protein